MKQKKELTFDEAYEKYGFLKNNKKQFTAFYNELSDKDKVSDLFYVKQIIKNIQEGCFYSMFINFAHKYSIKESFEYFSKIISKKELELTEEDLDKLCSDKEVLEFCEFIKDNNMEADIIDVLLSSVYDIIYDIDPYDASGVEIQYDDEIIKMYLAEIGKIDLMSPEEEKAKFRKYTRIRKKQQAIEEQIINQEVSEADAQKIIESLSAEAKALKDEITTRNLRLVVSVAKKYKSRVYFMSLLDLISEGNIGLMKAVDKFNIKRKCKFSTYATWWIRQSVTRSIPDNENQIRLPVHIYEKMNKIKAFQARYVNEYGVDPSYEEIGKEVKLDPEKVEYILLNLPIADISVDKEVSGPGEYVSGSGEKDSLGAFLTDPDAIPIEEFSETKEVRETIKKYLEILTPREKRILELRFGIKDGRERTLEEVGQTYGLTRERIRQIANKAIGKIFTRFAKEINTNYKIQIGDTRTTEEQIDDFNKRKTSIDNNLVASYVSEYRTRIECTKCHFSEITVASFIQGYYSCPECEKKEKREIQEQRKRTRGNN